jgi:hypothetical protein
MIVTLMHLFSILHWVYCLQRSWLWEALEVGIIGSEGVVGMPFILGVDVSPPPPGALVQMGGTALRITPTALRQVFNESGALRTSLLRYMQALYIQVSQTAVCNVVCPACSIAWG